MTKLMEKAIAAVSRLPKERQDQLAELLLSASTEEPIFVADDERQAIEEGLADANAGRFASKKEVDAFFSKHRVA